MFKEGQFFFYFNAPVIVTYFLTSFAFKIKLQNTEQLLFNWPPRDQLLQLLLLMKKNSHVQLVLSDEI